ncbi:MAG TPA: ATP-binding protein [Bryobacteraceae bacterium]|nr:ATP-binding protein [Bryobacteraceae bacterium]
MISEQNLPHSSRKVCGNPPTHVFRAFGGLKVRQKLAILHNVFFFVLAVSVYLSLIPLFATHLDAAKEREFRMVSQVFESDGSLGDLSAYGFREGSAESIGLPEAGRQYLAVHPAASWQDSQDLYRNDKRPGIYRRVTLPSEFYDSALRRARLSLFAALGTIYVLSIIVLEFLIMPQYVYQPLTLMLNADSATQRDDREHEMIDNRFILNDEIGQIMHSRNATVAQLRKHEDDLAGALQRLEEQDRLVSLGMLSTSVAHELNTPLAVLQGSIEKLQETTRDDAPTQERLARMLRVTQRLRKISEGLVDFARVRKRETEAIALRPIIEESWNLVAIDEKAAAVSFSNNVREGELVVGNADRLVQVFVNLLRNALIAVSINGEIRVETKHIQRGGHDWVCCTVFDNGPGIPADVLPNLFEAFVTTRLDARGTGLGLTVAEGIVTQHGGTISAANRPGGGASLEVTLPAA